MECRCIGVKAVIKNGVNKMIEEEAPAQVIEDYVNDMKSGQWVNCTCDVGKED